MREIVLDTETTGLYPLRGDRLVEIGCVEIFNRVGLHRLSSKLLTGILESAGGLGAFVPRERSIWLLG